MRVRTMVVGLAALTLAFVFLVNQAPALMSYQDSSQAASDSSATAVQVDSSVQDLPAGVPDATAGPVVLLLASEYLRRAKHSDAHGWTGLHYPEVEPTRRDQLTIMVDILSFASKPVSRKKLIRSLNMSHYQLKRYLAILIQKGLLLEQLGQSRTYLVTAKGSAFVELVEG
jgi:predicted transcriptional regulator